mmetsp:Transcript_15539/g.34806  ORF Transcript_15539/g.34806 Transcript_15539/m.34806 type:complete len:157 (+) Transcript_15539:1-471(+)
MLRKVKQAKSMSLAKATLPEKAAKLAKASKPNTKPGKPVPRVARPADEAQFIEWLATHVWKEGRSTVRRLGDLIPRPTPGRMRNIRLKRLLLEYRSRFVLDLQGNVYLNHSGRWRWGSQALATKRRNIGGGGPLQTALKKRRAPAPVGSFAKTPRR